MKILSLFSGIGAFEEALKKLGKEFEIVNYCEIDAKTSKAYSAIHNVSESLNLGDISKVSPDSLPDFDLMTWGFPCQDISSNGENKGIREGTRSGLYFCGLKILTEKQPTYSIIENVPNLLSKRHIDSFNMILSDLDKAGYNSYYKVLNAKDFGIPQNRERVFIISIRKDCDQFKNDGFPWPDPIDSGLRIKDFMDDIVDTKYYLRTSKTRTVVNKYKAIISPENRIIKVGELDHHKYNLTGRVFATEGISRTLMASDDGINVLCEPRIRRLTPRESWRLMGQSDENFNTAIALGIGETKLYKMAGNSIVVDVVESLLNILLK